MTRSGVQDREAKPRVVAGMGDRELVADGDPDQREHDQRQRPRAPQPDGAGVLSGLGHLDPDPLGALEVAPPERDGPAKPIVSASRRSSSNGSPANALAVVSTVSPSAMIKNSRKRSMRCPARDLGVPEVDAPATAGQPVQGPVCSRPGTPRLRLPAIRDQVSGSRAGMRAVDSP